SEGARRKAQGARRTAHGARRKAEGDSWRRPRYLKRTLKSALWRDSPGERRISYSNVMLPSQLTNVTPARARNALPDAGRPLTSKSLFFFESGNLSTVEVSPS